MIRQTFTRGRRRLAAWLRDETGTATVEFAIMFPIFVSIFLSSVELGVISLRHSMLERGLDMAVRDIRLGTGTNPQHDDIKAAICNYAGLLADCENSLRLEMIQVDPRNYTPPPGGADCIDHSEPVSAVRSFVNGQSNDLMMMRACYVFTPVFPTAWLGQQLVKDGAGNAAITAASAFVQEPR